MPDYETLNKIATDIKSYAEGQNEAIDRTLAKLKNLVKLLELQEEAVTELCRINEISIKELFGDRDPRIAFAEKTGEVPY